MKHRSLFGICVLLIGIGGSIGFQSPDAQPKDEEAAIRQAAEAYVKAYQAGDANALAALWGPDAEYINPTIGKKLKGRQAIGPIPIQRGQVAALFEIQPMPQPEGDHAPSRALR